MTPHRATRIVTALLAVAWLTPANAQLVEQTDGAGKEPEAQAAATAEAVDMRTEAGVTVVRHRDPGTTESATSEDGGTSAAERPAIVEVPLDHPLTQAVLEAMGKLADPDPETYDPAPIPKYRDRTVQRGAAPTTVSAPSQAGQRPAWKYTPIPYEYQPRRDFRYRDSVYRYIWRQRLTWRAAALVQEFGSSELASQWAPLVPRQQDVY